MNPLLKKVLGEADNSLFPDDAQEIGAPSNYAGKAPAPLVNVVQEPSQPTGEKEKYLTPYAALTAPDCTPDAMQPIDASKVPGGTGPERFTAADLESATEAPEVPETGLGQQNASVKVMDVILGRRRTGAPAPNAAQFAQAGTIQTAEEAAAVVAGMTINEEAAANAKVFAQTALVSAQEGGAMPEPTAASDGRAVYGAFRKFVG